MLNKLTNQFKTIYTKKDLESLESIEKQLVFDAFDSANALKLGNLIVEQSKEYDGEIVVLIHRQVDNLPVFQYVDNSKSQRNIDFALMKRTAVLQTKHCSLWGLVKNVVDGSVELGEDALPVGGSFPVIVNDEIEATVSISGLHDGLDFKLLVESISRFLQIGVPVFTGMLV